MSEASDKPRAITVPNIRGPLFSYNPETFAENACKPTTIMII
jgi:hypothetical protein